MFREPINLKQCLLALSFSFCAPAIAQDIKTQEQELAYEVGKVDLKAGITYEQANIIAKYYSQRCIAGRGSAYPAVDRNEYWEITPRIGVAGNPDKNLILISKYTGKISWGKGPVLRLTDLLNSKESAPKPINNTWPKHLSSGGLIAALKIQFVVLPSGNTTGLSIKHSSKNLKCDLAARRIVERWRFPQREQPITLVTSMEACPPGT